MRKGAFVRVTLTVCTANEDDVAVAFSYRQSILSNENIAGLKI